VTPAEPDPEADEDLDDADASPAGEPGEGEASPQAPDVEGDDEPEEDREPEVLILGTAHVVPLHRAIQHHVFEFEPDAVALELDSERLRGLLRDPEDRPDPGFGYGFIQRFQERVADDLGGEVGEEMLAAREAGMLLQVPVALVDKPARDTVSRLLDEMGWGERLKIAWSLFRSWLPGSGIEDELQRALEGDPELVDEVAKDFPTVKRVLIDERDEHMARRVLELVDSYPRVVLVVGDAHVPGIVKRLERGIDRIETVRVKELREHTDTGAGFSVEANTTMGPPPSNTGLMGPGSARED
jgi:pheromone shutdown protein TraB